jgi:hypothetical protein
MKGISSTRLGIFCSAAAIALLVLGTDTVLAQVADKYYSTEDLWRSGKAAYLRAVEDVKNNRENRAVSHYVNSLAYLFAYLQRRPELVTSTDTSAKSLRETLNKTHRYLSGLTSTAEVKGDIPAWLDVNPRATRAPKGTLRSRSESPVSTAIFRYPRIGNRRLDRCARWGKECGKPAARAFCQSKGFSRVTFWSIDRDIGDRDPTLVIRENKVCNNRNCDGFLEIVCTKKSLR